MIRLTLLRHAKSSWDDPALKDKQRPLNDRGRDDAALVARHVNVSGQLPDRILCSPAQRTRETLQIFLANWDQEPDAEFISDIYLASDKTLLDLVRAQDKTTRHLMLIGHNPGFHLLALRLAGGGAAEDIDLLAEKFPTTALISMAFEVESWQKIKKQQGRIEYFLAPKRLKNNP